MTSHAPAEDVPPGLFCGIGTEWTGQPFVVTTSAVAAYRHAVGITSPAPECGVAPPIYPAVASHAAYSALLVRVVPLPQLRTALHMSQVMTFHRPLRIGETVVTRAELIGVRTGSFGCFMVLDLQIRVGDELVSSAFHNVFIRGSRPTFISGRVELPPAPRRHGRGQTAFRKVLDIEPDKSILYGNASGDRQPIHMNESTARRLGFDGLILHGMCTLALCTDAVMEASPGTGLQVREVAATFTRPVLCGRDLDIRVVPGEDGILFVDAYQSGRPVIRGGWAKFSD